MGFHGFSWFYRRSALPIGHKEWFAQVSAPPRAILTPPRLVMGVQRAAQRLSMRLSMGFHGFSGFYWRSAPPIGHKE